MTADNDSDFVLHCFGESGNSYKVALALELNRLPWTPQLIAFFDGETRSPEFRDVNEMAEAPVLVHGSRRLIQSGVALRYLSRLTQRFAHENDDEDDEILRWILFDNHKFTANLATARFFSAFRPNLATPEAVEFLVGRFRAAFKVVEKRLAQREWIAAERPTIADISLAGYLFYPDEELPFKWSDYPATDAWRKRLRALDGWKAPYDLMPRALPADER